jgi:hypothetical protein
MNGPDARHWREAERVEMHGMHCNGVYTLMPESEVPKGANICQSRYVYDIKTDEKGNLSRYKIRWVAKGFSQRYGIDYFETFSPVARISPIRTLINPSATHNWSLNHLDVKTCFLEAELPDNVEIWVRPPEGYAKPGTVAKLHKSLYGLKQSSRAWSIKLASVLVDELGFTRLTSDTQVYKRTNKNGKTTYVGAYVDDLLVTGDDTDGIKQVKAELSKRFRISDLEECKWVLGCELKRDRNKRTAIFRQTKFINDVLKKFKLEKEPIVSTPAAPGDKLLKSWMPEKGSDEYVKMNRKRGDSDDVDSWSLATTYRGIVGSLLWISRCTRPDISWITSQLSRLMHHPPSFAHLERAIRVCSYLQGTAEQGIVIGGNENSQHNIKQDQLHAYSDASFCDLEDSSQVKLWVFSSLEWIANYLGSQDTD